MNDENLKPFKKGHKKVGGRKKGTLDIKTIVDKVLNQEIEIDDPLVNNKVKKKIIEAGLERQALRWLNGDNQAGRDLLDRSFGKSKESIEHSGGINIVKIPEGMLEDE